MSRSVEFFYFHILALGCMSRSVEFFHFHILALGRMSRSVKFFHRDGCYANRNNLHCDIVISNCQVHFPKTINVFKTNFLGEQKNKSVWFNWSREFNVIVFTGILIRLISGKNVLTNVRSYLLERKQVRSLKSANRALTLSCIKRYRSSNNSPASMNKSSKRIIN